MADPVYLITGATGTTGRAAVAALRHAGKRVRALVHKDDARAEALRKLGTETVVGEMLDLDQVRAAMEGVRGAYFVYPFKPGLIDAAAFFAQAAIEAGVKSRSSICRKSPRGGRRKATHLAIIGSQSRCSIGLEFRQRIYVRRFSRNGFSTQWMAGELKRASSNFPLRTDDTLQSPARIRAALLQLCCKVQSPTQARLILYTDLSNSITMRSLKS